MINLEYFSSSVAKDDNFDTVDFSVCHSKELISLFDA